MESLYFKASDLLEILSCYGESYGLSKEELSYIPIDEILSSMNDIGSYSVETSNKYLQNRIKKYNVNLAIRLPLAFLIKLVHRLFIPSKYTKFYYKNKINAETSF